MGVLLDPEIHSLRLRRPEERTRMVNNKIGQFAQRNNANIDRVRSPRKGERQAFQKMGGNPFERYTRCKATIRSEILSQNREEGDIWVSDKIPASRARVFPSLPGMGRLYSRGPDMSVYRALWTAR